MVPLDKPDELVVLAHWVVRVEWDELVVLVV